MELSLKKYILALMRSVGVLITQSGLAEELVITGVGRSPAQVSETKAGPVANADLVNAHPVCDKKKERKIYPHEYRQQLLEQRESTKGVLRAS
jgi:hypothetical protein